MAVINSPARKPPDRIRPMVAYMVVTSTVPLSSYPAEVLHFSQLASCGSIRSPAIPDRAAIRAGGILAVWLGVQNSGSHSPGSRLVLPTPDRSLACTA